MRLILHPILRELRAVYDVGELYSMERYWAYKRLMVDGPELLPLGDFSPMGKRQPEYLDRLIGMEAERQAAEFLKAVESEPWSAGLHGRVLLVVADQPGNGWTQRWLTDAAWRFEGEKLPPSAQQTAAGRWITVQLWTHVEPTPAYLRSQLRSAVRRAAWQAHHGRPLTLDAMLQQEGAALAAGDGAFGGAPLPLDPDDLAYTREVLAPLRNSDHWPACFAALYGDEAAREVGYPALGLSSLTGFSLALAETSVVAG
ncbi:hypothetical protein [Deinococcus sonorensis]|uniref:Uncharacterized protein n=2 Tax=Deinococcus sonorensis TaxID=309891 RepID=A0AAU7UA19_9DEIO